MYKEEDASPSGMLKPLDEDAWAARQDHITMNNKRNRTGISIVLAFMMVFALIPQMSAFGLKAGISDSVVYADDDEDIKDLEEATKSYTEALEKFVSKGEDLTKLERNLEHLDGLLSVMSGSITIMEALGILEDPTDAMLQKILSSIISVQEKLKEMDKELKSIIDDLREIAIEQVEDQRVNLSMKYQDRWKEFELKNKGSLTNLKADMAYYQALVEDEKKAWLKEGTHEGLRVFYARDDTGDGLIHVFSNTSYEEGVPDKSIAGETILKDACIGLPSEYMPDTGNMKYKKDTWTKDVTDSLAAAFKAAADAGKLDWSDSYKDQWSSLSDKEKDDMAAVFAPDLLDSLLHDLACTTMSSHHTWASTLKSHFEEFLSTATTEGYGLDALVQVYYNTNGFEGEAKEAIEKQCDFIIAMTGYYGTFVLNTLGQDDEYSIEQDLKPLQKTWAETVNNLTKLKKNAIKKRDNYCYITGTLIDYREMAATSTVKLEYDYVDASLCRKEDISSSPWILVNENNKTEKMDTIDKVLGGVLYRQFLHQSAEKEGQKTFSAYLNKNEVGIPEKFKGKITTDYQGQDSFDLSDRPWLLSSKAIGKFFKDDKWYQINKTGHDDGPFELHDKIIYDYLDAGNGSQASGQVLAYRSAFCQGKKTWARDEMYAFAVGCDFPYNDKVIGKTTITYLLDTYEADVILRTYKYRAPVNVLQKKSLKKDDDQTSGPDPGMTLRKDLGNSQNIAKPAAAEHSKADWSDLAVDNLDLYQKDDKKMERGIPVIIDQAIAKAREEGLDVSLNAEEKADLAEKMKDKIFEMQRELERNQIVSRLDVLGIDGDKSREMELAARTLHGTYLSDRGESLIPPENINTMAEYEPYMMLHFEKKNGKVKAVINPAFDVVPVIVFWDPGLKKFEETPVYEKDMREMGLTMKVYLPASFIKSKKVEVVHYDGHHSMDVLEKETKTVKGSGTNKYVTMNTTSCSPFELRTAYGGGSGSGGTATGDEMDMTLLIILLITSLCISTLLIVRRRLAAK